MKEIKEINMMCIECEGKGYFEDVISEGLQPGDPYLEPHVERCDECKVFANDEEALAFLNDEPYISDEDKQQTLAEIAAEKQKEKNE
jgi:hypothetical protein